MIVAPWSIVSRPKAPPYRERTVRARETARMDVSFRHTARTYGAAMKNLIRMTIVLGSLFTITAYAGPNDSKAKPKTSDKKDTTATDKDTTATPDPKTDDKKDADKPADTTKSKDKAPATTKDKKTTN
jgi:hypothetical protein